MKAAAGQGKTLEADSYDIREQVLSNEAVFYTLGLLTLSKFSGCLNPLSTLMLQRRGALVSPGYQLGSGRSRGCALPPQPPDESSDSQVGP
jgi:hypothetical protein